MKVIGLTGGIAVGKSMAADYLTSQYQLPIIDADQLTHALLTKEGKAYPKVVNLFGETVIDQDRQLNRNKIADQIFSDAKLRLKLNQIMHPLIIAKIDTELEKLKKTGVKLVLVSATLILEVGIKERFDQLIIILSKPELQAERLLQTRGLTKAQAESRLHTQWSNEQRLKVKDAHLIWNNSKQTDFIADLDKIYKTISISSK